MRTGIVSSPSAVQLGERVWQRRRQRGLTQGELAERAGISLNYLGEIERGEANVTIDALGKLMTALEWDLFDADRPPIARPTKRLLLRHLRQTRVQLKAVIAWVRELDPAVPTRPPSRLAPTESKSEPLTSGPRRRALPNRRQS